MLYWSKMLKCRSCFEAGPILKFARWVSVPEVWEWFRPEIALLKPVLEEMSGDTDHLVAEVLAATTAQHDAELAEKLTSSKSGLIHRAPGYITPALFRHLDIFCSVSHPLCKYYSYRTGEIKNTVDGFRETMVFGAEQGWLQLLADIFADGMSFGPHLRKCGCTSATPPEERQENIEIMVQFTLDTVSEIAVRFYPMLEVLPHAAIRVLHQDAKGHVRPAVTEFLHLWRAICDLEELAAKGVQAAVRVLARRALRGRRRCFVCSWYISSTRSCSVTIAMTRAIRPSGL